MDVSTIVTGICTALLAIVAYFTKRTMGELDATKKELSEVEDDINAVRLEYATKTELKELKEDIKSISSAIGDLKCSTITKDDLTMEMAKVMDGQKRMMDILDEVRYGSK